MGGLASKRCDSCRKLVMVSDRGDVETVGAARSVGTDRAMCACGMLVTWPKRVAAGPPTFTAEGALAHAHPRNGRICAEIGHEPLNEPLTERQSGRIVTYHNVCSRCGAVYASEAHI